MRTGLTPIRILSRGTLGKGWTMQVKAQKGEAHRSDYKGA